MDDQKVVVLPPVKSGDTESSLNDCISCEVVENANESFELTLTYPIYGENFRQLQISARIQCKPNPYDEKKTFLIYYVSRPIGGVITVKAEHISYQIAGTICRGGTENSTGNTAQEIIGYLGNEIGMNPGIGIMTFFTDISDTESEYNYDKPTDGRQILTDAAAKFGGIWKFSDHSAQLLKNRGQDRGFSIEYGVNMLESTKEEDITERYTHICPFWIGNVTETKTIDGEEVEVTEEQQVYTEEMYIPIYGDDSYFKPYLYDCSKLFEEKPEEEDLRNAAAAFAMDPVNGNTLGKRTTSLTVNFIALKKTSEYINDPDYDAEKDHVEIGDAVTVKDRYGETTKMICMSTTYDVLKDRYIKIEVGYKQAASAAEGVNAVAKATQPRTPKTIAGIERKLKQIETDTQTVHVPTKIEKISANEVKAYYPGITITRTAEGEGDERHNFKRTVVGGAAASGYISAEEAAAIMMSGGGSGGDTPEESGEEIPAESLEYINNDPDYVLPESITPDAGETFDTITAIYHPDNSKFAFSEDNTYRSGDFVLKDSKTYICNLNGKSITSYQGEWNTSYFKEQDSAFDYASNRMYYSYDRERSNGIEYTHQVTQYFAYMDEKWYKCIKYKRNDVIKTWEEAKSEGYFQELKVGEAPYLQIKDVYGIGIVDKDTDDETVTRLIYPDFTQTLLINFDL